MRKIAICDDDPGMLDRLEQLVHQFIQDKGLDFEIHQFEDSRKLAECYATADQPFDILILDIEMPDLDGMTLAERIRQADSKAPILFVTSHERFVFQAYEVEALRYIPKAVMEQSLPKALDAALKKLAREKAYIVLPSRGCELRLMLDEILYVEKSGKNCIYYSLSGENYPVRRPLAAAMEELDAERFVLVNSGSAVNMAHIKMLDKSSVQLVDGACLPVSRLRAAAVKQRLHQYWSSLR